MLLRVEVHPGFLLGGGLLGYSHPTAALRSTGSLDEYRGAPPHRRPVAAWNEPEKSRLGGSRCAGALAGAETNPTQ